jgi:hypothetical protein
MDINDMLKKKGAKASPTLTERNTEGALRTRNTPILSRMSKFDLTGDRAILRYRLILRLERRSGVCSVQDVLEVGGFSHHYYNGSHFCSS